MTAPEAELRWEPPFPTDIALTLGRAQQGPRDPTQQRDPAGGVWRTLRTPEGAATIHVDRAGAALRALAWGPGAQIAVDSAPALLGAADDPTAFEPRHPVLVAAHHRFAGLRIAGSGDVLHGLVGAILEQRVEGGEAMAAWFRLVRSLGDPAPGPAPAGMRVFPDGAPWLRLADHEWRAAGVDARRAATIRRVAERDRSLQRLVGRAPDEVRRALTAIPGVGQWTASEVLQRSLGDVDAVSVGDFHLARIVGATLAGRPFDDAELVAFLEPWRPQRYRVTRLLSASGIESLPRRAPRRSRR